MIGDNYFSPIHDRPKNTKNFSNLSRYSYHYAEKKIIRHEWVAGKLLSHTKWLDIAQSTWKFMNQKKIFAHSPHFEIGMR